ncbi:isochorismatase family protein [Brevibacterium sp. 5221]|uniref:Isochorismatase family protein n=1 Tax=Brevibacterium rongguiense TaxID=2695267 RepID=A0A6N9H8G7_9MICO|nr:isochorismatase family protein [Brevibacterium rongguiense]MYM20263.1 isochorismatase family protein [Brevibacterium rongguiense]
MDALVFVNAHAAAAAAEPLALLLRRARTAQGVVVFVTAPAQEPAVPAPEEDAGAPAGPGEAPAAPEAPRASASPGPEDLVLASPVADAFDGVEDLAPGLEEMGIDRIVLAGADEGGALRETALAALTLGFDLVLVADACTAPEGGPVAWLGEAEELGALLRPAREAWLRM